MSKAFVQTILSFIKLKLVCSKDLALLCSIVLVFVDIEKEEEKKIKREKKTRPYHDTIISAGRCITVEHTRYFPPKLIILAGTEQPAQECLISTGLIVSGMPDRVANVRFSPARYFPTTTREGNCKSLEK